MRGLLIIILFLISISALEAQVDLKEFYGLRCTDPVIQTIRSLPVNKEPFRELFVENNFHRYQDSHGAYLDPLFFESVDGWQMEVFQEDFASSFFTNIDIANQIILDYLDVFIANLPHPENAEKEFKKKIDELKKSDQISKAQAHISLGELMDFIPLDDYHKDLGRKWLESLDFSEVMNSITKIVKNPVNDKGEVADILIVDPNTARSFCSDLFPSDYLYYYSKVPFIIINEIDLNPFDSSCNDCKSLKVGYYKDFIELGAQRIKNIEDLNEPQVDYAVKMYLYHINKGLENLEEQYKEGNLDIKDLVYYRSLSSLTISKAFKIMDDYSEVKKDNPDYTEERLSLDAERFDDSIKNFFSVVNSFEKSFYMAEKVFKKLNNEETVSLVAIENMIKNFPHNFDWDVPLKEIVVFNIDGNAERYPSKTALFYINYKKLMLESSKWIKDMALQDGSYDDKKRKRSIAPLIVYTMTETRSVNNEIAGIIKSLPQENKWRLREEVIKHLKEYYNNQLAYKFQLNKARMSDAEIFPIGLSQDEALEFISEKAWEPPRIMDDKGNLVRVPLEEDVREVLEFQKTIVDPINEAYDFNIGLSDLGFEIIEKMLSTRYEY